MKYQERTFNPKKHKDQRRKRPTELVKGSPYAMNRHDRLKARALFRQGKL